MKKSNLSLGVLSVVFFLLVALVSIDLSVYGLILAFKASLILGVIVLLVEPLPLILGVLALLGHPEIARLVAAWLGLL